MSDLNINVGEGYSFQRWPFKKEVQYESDFSILSQWLAEAIAEIPDAITNKDLGIHMENRVIQYIRDKHSNVDLGEITKLTHQKYLELRND